MLDATAYLDSIRTEATALVDAAEQAGLDAPVPACPDWTVADLLEHVGRVHRWAARSSTMPPSDEFPSGSAIEIPEPAVRPGWVRAGAVELVAALDRPSDAPSWTWIPPNTVGFWQRRQAHETAMHRVDAESAGGTPHEIDDQLAADGIDELLEIVATTPWREPPTGDGESLHFHCTDVTGEWLVRLTPEGVDVAREHAKGDVAARGTASDLLCWLQGRGPVERLEVLGDEVLLARWREVATF